MTKVLGWVNDPASSHAGSDLRGKALGSLSGAAENRFKDSHNALFDSDENIVALDGHVISITGDPRWSDPDLAKIARTRGQHAAVLEAYRREDINLTQSTEGACRLIILSPREKQLFAAIDRFGIYPLHYSHNKSKGLRFADSADFLANHPSSQTTLSNQALFNYVYFHMVPSPGTIYAGINKLEPGQYLRHQNGNLEIGDYWSPKFEETNPSSIDSLSEELLDVLSASIQAEMTEDRIGAFLSGGLDSSSVAGVLANESGRTVNTYTIGFNAKGYDETEYARIAAKHFKTNHKEFYLKPQDVVEIIPQIAEACGEPFGNSSAVPAFFCAKNAKEEGTKLLLAGDGGDEIFAGNMHYATQKLYESYFLVPALFRRLLEKSLHHLPLPQSVPLFRKANNFVNQALVPLPDRMENYNFLHRQALSEIFSDDFLKSVNTSEPIDALRRKYQQPDSTSSLNRMLFLDWKTTLSDNDLRKVSGMCELAGIKVAYPMLDKRMVEFSCRIPSNLKLKGQKLRYFYKRAMRNFLPDEILQKSKHGFGLPFGVWMRDHRDLREFAYNNVNQLKHRGFIKASFIDNAIEMHRSVHAPYYGELIWILMMLECWLDNH